MHRLSAVVLALLIGACQAGTTGPTTTPKPTLSAASTTSPTTTPRPVVIDTDLSDDDLVAIALVLGDARVSVRAITVAGTGLVHCYPGLDNVRALLERLDALPIPVACGRRQALPPAVAFPDAWRAGADAAFGITLPEVPVITTPAASTLLAEIIHASPVPTTILELAPWTNLADALAADPALPPHIAQIVAMGGTISHPGNVYRDGVLWSAPVEANFAADPRSITAVMSTSIPISLIPLDATDAIPVPSDIAAQLLVDPRTAAADVALELFARNPFLTGVERGQYLWDETAAMALLEPSLMHWQQLRLTVGTTSTMPGRIEPGAGGRTMSAATAADPTMVTSAILAHLRQGPPAASPFRLGGPVSFTSDGVRCSLGSAPTGPGATLVRFQNDGDTRTTLLLLTAVAPHTVDDIVALARTFNAATDQVPSWVSLLASVDAKPGASAWGFAEVPATTVVPLCGVGDPSDPTLVVGAPTVWGP